MSHPTRTRTRNRLYLIGVLPALLMLLVSGRITLLLIDESSGLSAFGAEEYDAARGDFAANQVLNPFEPWIAPFDEGTARHRGDDLKGAVSSYEEALDAGVPPEWGCRVRNNLALAHEGLGDGELEARGRVAAEDEWLIARAVLGDCLDLDESKAAPPVDANGDGTVSAEEADADGDGSVSAEELSAVIDERLAVKLEDHDAAPTPPASDPPPPAVSLEERLRELEERDRRALEQRRLQEQRREARGDSREDPGSEAPPVPAW